MQNWQSLFKELAEKISADIPAIRWIDLWHNQISFLDTEHPFPTPAVFLGFRSANIKDMSVKVQHVSLQIDVYLFYETFADTYKGSWNQTEALAFLDHFDNLYKCLHGTDGEQYSSMRRINFAPVDTGGSGNLYLQTFGCEIIDYTASKAWEEGGFADVETNVETNGFDDVAIS